MPIDVNGERFLNMTESADYLGITRQTLKKKIAEWKMTPYVAEVGRAKYLSEAELKKHLGLKPATPQNTAQ